MVITWNEIIQIVTGLIVSVGGAGAIILGFSYYFGNIWASRYLESIKNEYQKDYEEYRTKLEMLKVTNLRYSDQQFKFYQTFWDSIFELKLLADDLWDSVTDSNLKKYSKQLKKTMSEVEKKSLFIEENHYVELRNILNAFNNFEYGKKKLINLYKQGVQLDINEVQEWITYNRDNKVRYENLINLIRDELRNKLRGNV